MNKVIAIISDEDVKEMRKIFEKKCALENLTKISEENLLVNNEELYKKFINDYTTTQNELDNYWGYLENKYSLKKNDNSSWSIDFNTGNIFLDFNIS